MWLKRMIICYQKKPTLISSVITLLKLQMKKRPEHSPQRTIRVSKKQIHQISQKRKKSLVKGPWNCLEERTQRLLERKTQRLSRGKYPDIVNEKRSKDWQRTSYLTMKKEPIKCQEDPEMSKGLKYWQSTQTISMWKRPIEIRMPRGKDPKSVKGPRDVIEEGTQKLPKKGIPRLL